MSGAATLGVACTQDTDCGALDSRCLTVSSTKRVCGIACADTVGCPSGTQCLLPKGKTSPDDLQCSAH